MKTRFEIIAEAYPLHSQRIAEATYDEGGEIELRYLFASTKYTLPDAGIIVSQCFVWSRTTEGYDYWQALCLN